METKVCCHCREALPVSSFQKNRTAPDGLQYRCKKCTQKASADCRAKRGHLWRQKTDPWSKRPENRERRNATTRARQARRDPALKREERYRWTLSHKYGLTPELKKVLLYAQDYKCSICSDVIDFHCSVDHCHAHDYVRGLLCDKCNSALGLFKDNPEILRNAALYLEESRKPIVDEDFSIATQVFKDYLENRNGESKKSEVISKSETFESRGPASSAPCSRESDDSRK